MSKPKILGIDIETAPTLAFIWDLATRYVPPHHVAAPGYTMCWAARWFGTKGKIMYRSIHHHGEEAMVQGAWELLNEADIVVHYNGTKFDIPKLNQEFAQWNLGPPSPFQEVDLYRTAKGRFKLLSNSMNYLAKHLGVEQKLSNKGMQLWTECLEGSPSAWKDMKAYNIQDVVVLEKLYDRLLPWIQPHPNMGLYSDDADVVCPSCGSTNLQRRGHYYTDVMRYQRLHCQDCGKWSRVRTNDLSSHKRKTVIRGVK